MPDAKQFFYVIVDEGEPARVASCSSFPELKARLSDDLHDEADGRRQVFVFSGARWLVTTGQFKHLVAPDGKRVPLFDQPVETLPREDGLVDGVLAEVADVEDDMPDHEYQIAGGPNGHGSIPSGKPFNDAD